MYLPRVREVGYTSSKFLTLLKHLKAMSYEAIFSCNLQRNGVSSCFLQEKSPPVTLLVCKIIRLQVIQQLAYVYNSTGAWNIFFTQICVTSSKKKLPRVAAPLNELQSCTIHAIELKQNVLLMICKYFEYAIPVK